MIQKSDEIRPGEKPDLMKVFGLIKSMKKDGFSNLKKNYVIKLVNEIGQKMPEDSLLFKVEPSVNRYLKSMEIKVH